MKLWTSGLEDIVSLSSCGGIISKNMANLFCLDACVHDADQVMSGSPVLSNQEPCDGDDCVASNLPEVLAVRLPCSLIRKPLLQPPPPPTLLPLGPRGKCI